MVSVDLEPGTIPPGHLKLDEVPHITIVFLGNDVDDEAFARACRRAAEAAARTDGPVIAAASGVASFPPGDGGKAAVYMPVGSPALHQLRAALEDLSASEHKDYIPHITLDYAEPGKPLPEPPPPLALAFTHISVHRGKEVKKYPFRDQGHPVVKLTDVHPYDRFERGREELVHGYTAVHRALGESSAGKGKVHEFTVTGPGGKYAAYALAYDKGSHVWLDQLTTATTERRHHLGSRLLEYVAGQFPGREVRLKPEPYGAESSGPHLDEAELRSFYGRHGFQNAGEEMVRPSSLRLWHLSPTQDLHIEPGHIAYGESRPSMFLADDFSLQRFHEISKRSPHPRHWALQVEVPASAVEKRPGGEYVADPSQVKVIERVPVAEALARTAHIKLASDVHPSLLGEVSKQVKGYFRTEHGKLEHVGPYLERKPEHTTPEQKWLDANGRYLMQVDSHGVTHAIEVGGSNWELVPSWREKKLWHNAVEITGHPHLPEPTGPVAEPAVTAEPGFDPAPLRRYLTATLTPAELDVLNKGGVTWHIVPAKTLDPTGNTMGLYDGSKLTVFVAGDIASLGGRDAEAYRYGHTLTHVALHETGHAIDHALGWVSQRDPLAGHFAAKVFPAESHPASGPDEGFAELFALLHDHTHTRELAGESWQDVTLPEKTRREAQAWLESVEASVPATGVVCIARLQDGHLVFGPPGGSQMLVKFAQSLVADVVTAGILELAGLPLMEPAAFGAPIAPPMPGKGIYEKPGDTISGWASKQQRYHKPGDTISGHAYHRFPSHGFAGAGPAGGAGALPPPPGSAGENQPAQPGRPVAGPPRRSGGAGRGSGKGRQRRR